MVKKAITRIVPGKMFSKEPRMTDRSKDDTTIAQDVSYLHKMGYAQELSRGLKVFSSFAISFSVICIASGGVTSFQLGFSAGGGLSVSLGWLVGGLFALVVAASMAQIASAYPTAGGLYHWSTILGGRAWGWATAWLNLVAYILSTASVNVGVYLLFSQLVLTNIFHVNVAGWGYWQQLVGMMAVTISQALLNGYSLRGTRLLTDFSGYFILAVTLFLIVIMITAAPGLDFSRLWHFTNFTGAAGGGVYPNHLQRPILVFALGLILPLYTITGYDASAHIAEETIDARRTVPRGIVISVAISAIFGLFMVCSFVLAMPDVNAAAKNGGNVFFDLLSGLRAPVWCKDFLYISIVVLNYLCGLANVTACSRLMFAFSRDGGLPFSNFIRTVHPKFRTPANATWVGAGLAIAATLYSSAFNALATGAAIFFYVSYVMPTVAGFFAKGRSWTDYGPFQLGVWSKPMAGICGLGAVGIVFIGVQPPNNVLITYVIGIVILLILGWFLIERKRFAGPPLGEQIAIRQANIKTAEMALEAAG
jgi:amino acid transporter